MEQGYKVIANIAKNQQKLEKKIKGKDFLLGKYYQKNNNFQKRPKCFCNSKIQNTLRIQEKLSNQMDIEKTLQYYKPLNQLWSAYMTDLIGEQKSEESCMLKILRSDFHGCFLKIIYSKVNSCIGVSGIVIKETLKTFTIMTQQNKQIMILKSVNSFLVNINERHFIIHGSSLTYRPSDRSKHKFKFKKAEKMNLQLLGQLLED